MPQVITTNRSMAGDFFYFGPMEKLLTFGAAIALAVAGVMEKDSTEQRVVTLAALVANLAAAALAVKGGHRSRSEQGTAIVPQVQRWKLSLHYLFLLVAIGVFVPFVWNWVEPETKWLKYLTMILALAKVLWSNLLYTFDAYRMLSLSKIVREGGWQALEDESV